MDENHLFSSKRTSKTISKSIDSKRSSVNNENSKRTSHVESRKSTLSDFDKSRKSSLEKSRKSYESTKSEKSNKSKSSGGFKFLGIRVWSVFCLEKKVLTELIR